MGIPGPRSSNEQQEMSSALTDNHSPVSIAEEDFKANNNKKLEVEENNPMMEPTTNKDSIKEQIIKEEEEVKTEQRNGNHSLSNNSTTQSRLLANNDVSSDDVDVITNDNDHKPFPSPQKMTDSSSRAVSGAGPEPNLKERLKRVKTQVVNALIKHPKSQAFRAPVNAKALGIYPIYHQIITKPMDLGTVKKKIDAVQYRSRRECLDDIQLVWTNAKTFNAKGHFVHEAALVMENVTRDKVAKLEKAEADGLFDLPKMPKKVLDVPPREEPRPERKIKYVQRLSQDYDIFPGEVVQQPQHQQVKKKPVENVGDQLKKCEVVLKELLAGKHSYVEPFLRSRKYNGMSTDSLNIYKIQQRLQNGFYRHALQFGNDFRRMISETYKYCQAHDPLVEQAAELQHHFEVLFCRVDFEPVENPADYDFSSEDDAFHNHLLSVQAEVVLIQNNVNDLIKCLGKFRSQGLSKKQPKSNLTNNNNNNNKRNNSRANPGKRGRPASTSSGPSPPKKPQKSPLTPEESIALRTGVAELNEEQQQRIVQIMQENNEVLSTDANGYTEIDLGNCSAKTVRQIQAFIKKVKPKKPAAKRARTSASPVKRTNNKDNNHSDSSSAESSEEEDDDEDNSSSSSSSSATDSE